MVTRAKVHVETSVIQIRATSNIEKSKVICFSTSNLSSNSFLVGTITDPIQSTECRRIALTKVSSLRYLGVIVDEKLERVP